MKQYKKTASYITTITTGINITEEKTMKIKIEMLPNSVILKNLEEIKRNLDIESSSLPKNERKIINPLKNSKILSMETQNDEIL